MKGRHLRLVRRDEPAPPDPELAIHAERARLLALAARVAPGWSAPMVTNRTLRREVLRAVGVTDVDEQSEAYVDAYLRALEGR